MYSTPIQLYVCVYAHFGHVQLFVTLWTAAHQAPLSMGFSRQEYWRGQPFPSLGDFPDPGIELASPVSPALQADSLSTEPSGKPFRHLDTPNKLLYMLL